MLECNYHCPHSGEERMLQGTWCTPEIHKAIEKGYRLIQIHEVRDFLQCRKGLFQLYVDTWLKIKQESGGSPNWVRTIMQKEEYICRYEEKEGIWSTLPRSPRTPEEKPRPNSCVTPSGWNLANKTITTPRSAWQPSLHRDRHMYS